MGTPAENDGVEPVGSADRLFALVYDELHALAGSYFRRQRGDHTLDTTDLVHEAYVKLADRTDPEYGGRTHFFAVAATAMRQILVNHALSRRTQKRGGGRRKVSMTRADELAVRTDDDIIALDEALKRLAELHGRKSKVVEARFFGGMTMDEIAESLAVSKTTVESDWRMARAWLSRDLAGVQHHDA